jgi:sulfite dehydrogenase
MSARAGRWSRRDFLKVSGVLASSGALAACAGVGGTKSLGHVVVIGGGYGGATAAKYLRLWSEGAVAVTLVERNANFVSCPISNLVIAGERSIADVTVGYEGLGRHGVNVVRDEVVGVDAARRTVKLAGGSELTYDRLVVSPGVDFMYETLPGLRSAEAQEKVLHSWKAGPQTLALRKQLEAMPDGGIFALCIPKAPYRCPPGPYERACMVAHYFKKAKPKSKVLILDANEDIVSKKGLFTKVWADQYKGMVEYRPASELRDVDAATNSAILEFDKVRANVLNVIPPQRAGNVARIAGLITANDRWCGIDWLSMESVAQKNIHVLGDATLSAPMMPKSGHMANQHAKVAAAAILNLLAGQPPNPEPMVMNTCYSFVDDRNVVHVASVHRYDPAQKLFVTVPGSGGLSPAPSEIEGKFAFAWAKNIWADMLS